MPEAETAAELPSQEPTRSPLPERVGPYRILDEIGSGGFGVVYEAEQREPLRRRVAVKVIKPGMDSAAVVARFEAERQALALMDHPHIARVLDGGLTEHGRPYFAMELVRGVPITEHCDRQKLGIRERVELFIRVCDAVQHAHAKGVIHRDLKPSNILVAIHGNEHIPKIIDFGVAKALSQSLTDAPLHTRIGQLIGTPEYMSPEQAEMTSQDIDTRSDVYSLGVVLYELLAGVRPFDAAMLSGAPVAEVQRILRETEPQRPSTRLSTAGASSGSDQPTRIAAARRTELRSLTGVLRRDLDWVIMRCLEKDRTRRYETAHALADDLRRYLADEPVSAGPPTAMYRARKFVRRHRGGVTASLLVAGCIVAFGAASTVFYFREAHARALAETARQQAETERAVALAINAFLNDDLLGAVDPEADGPDVRVVDILDRAVGTLDGRFVDRPEIGARLRSTLGGSYLELGRPERAEPLLREAVAALEAAGDASDSTLIVRLELVESLWRRGRAQEALELARQVESATASRDPTDPVRLTTLNQLANAYKYADRIDEARPVYEQVLKARLQANGPRHVDTLRASYNLALLPVLRGVAARRAGDDSQANRFFEQGLHELRDVHTRAQEALGADHSFTLTCASEVLSQLNRLGLVDEAEPLYRSLLDTMDRRLGPQHWRRLQTTANFGRMLMRESRPTEAAPLLSEALEGYRAWRGVESAETLTITRWLASTEASLGEVGRALWLLERALHELPNDAAVKRELIDLGAEVLRDAQRADDAEAWLQRWG
ncbi:MAG: protein kinase domain-containing protein [Phycisphaerales bacterium]